jgi:hypothetical protein
MATPASCFHVVPVAREWLIDQVTAAIIKALPQVTAVGSQAELVNVLHTKGLSTRLEALCMQVSDLQHGRTFSYTAWASGWILSWLTMRRANRGH